MKYNVGLTHLKGKDNVIAHTLSHVSLLNPETADKDDYNVIPVHYIMSEVSAMEFKLERVRVVTKADLVTSQLKHQILERWPDARRRVPESIHSSWNYRDEMISKAHKLVIPVTQKHEFLKDLHIDHLREGKTLFRAR